jgi:hypothetical protein
MLCILRYESNALFFFAPFRVLSRQLLKAALLLNSAQFNVPIELFLAFNG